MSVWEKFETECVEYLNRTFGAYASFEGKGGSDSTVSDIKVSQLATNPGKQFYIEAKHCPAQCGQFVLLPNLRTRTFEYSRLNATKINPYSMAIIEYMNGFFEEYKEAGTAGKDINIENGPAIFASWIIQAYKDKGAKLIITNNKVILPVESFSRYFNVTATYRIKRSGSSSVGRGRMKVVSDYLKKNYPITSILSDKDKLFVTSDRYLHNRRFIIDGTEYMISMRDNRYEIRRLSNTFNANVIFSIDLKSGVRGLSDRDFISFLR